MALALHNALVEALRERSARLGGGAAAEATSELTGTRTRTATAARLPPLTLTQSVLNEQSILSSAKEGGGGAGSRKWTEQSYTNTLGGLSLSMSGAEPSALGAPLTARGAKLLAIRQASDPERDRERGQLGLLVDVVRDVDGGGGAPLDARAVVQGRRGERRRCDRPRLPPRVRPRRFSELAPRDVVRPLGVRRGERSLRAPRGAARRAYELSRRADELSPPRAPVAAAFVCPPRPRRPVLSLPQRRAAPSAGSRASRRRRAGRARSARRARRRSSNG